jgi:hypothetical protein
LLGEVDVHERLRTIVLPSVVIRGETVSAHVLKTTLRTAVDCGGIVDQIPTLAALSLVTVRRSLEALQDLQLISDCKEKRVRINARAISDFQLAPSAVSREVA